MKSDRWMKGMDTKEDRQPDNNSIQADRESRHEPHKLVKFTMLMRLNSRGWYSSGILR